MKTLLEQWQDDCERLSEPHLQWEFLSPTTGEWLQKKTAPKFYSGICYRRIESLARPFDLEDAINGGKFQLFYGSEWIDAELDDDILIGCDWMLESGDNLRMKESRLKTTGLEMDNEITYTANYGCKFTSKNRDLSNGVSVRNQFKTSLERVTADSFEFGGWFVINILPTLKSFQGLDSVNFKYIESKNV